MVEVCCSDGRLLKQWSGVVVVEGCGIGRRLLLSWWRGVVVLERCSCG